MDDTINCLAGVGSIVEVHDLYPGDWIADETGEPVKVIEYAANLISTNEGDIEVPPGVKVRRLDFGG